MPARLVKWSTVKLCCHMRLRPNLRIDKLRNRYLLRLLFRVMMYWHESVRSRMHGISYVWSYMRRRKIEGLILIDGWRAVKDRTLRGKLGM